jgi:hypothetical protein
MMVRGARVPVSEERATPAEAREYFPGVEVRTIMVRGARGPGGLSYF